MKVLYQVRWGDKKGGYGEHYWDLNHAGHNNDHGNDGYDNSDDGSYHEEANDPYDEPSQNSPTYGHEEYDPEKASYEETSRNKRAHPKVKVERKTVESYEEKEQPQHKRKNIEKLQAAASHNVDTSHEDQTPSVVGLKHKQKRQPYTHQGEETKEKQQVVLVVNHKNKDQDNQGSQYVQRRPEPTHYVPYESGAGVRQHHQDEATAAASVPRLFLEPSTGHVVDRATGQAYVLQPITKHN
ncbi:Uncharacterized protein OBRU01_04099 [Operophtera brumata]|uniref:Uncharacterized protein n=1 Tax=Operophtera brumata TaxID=104452 RepID=A0A0L7LPE3_OPEBR|nr:Uncharacterized protein OBRU01_04099 [Operophtera brumata]